MTWPVTRVNVETELAWATLAGEIKECRACKLQTECKQVVPGDGCPGTMVLFLGESPGEQEDIGGKPFMGPAGKFLHGTLKRRGIPSEETFFTNIVRCRPPDDRDPEPEEIDACWKWTKRTLALVQPKIIVTLGKYSLGALAHRYGFSRKLGSQIKITSVAGRPVWVEDQHCYIYPMYHPAFASRSRVRREEFDGHMRFLVASLPGWLARP